MRWFVLASFIWGILLVTPVAHSGDTQEARAHFKEGVALLKKGKYERAVIELERSQKLDPKPRTLFKIAETEAALNNLDRAIKAYERFLEEGVDEASQGRRRKALKEIARLKAIVEKEQSEKKNKKKAAAFHKNGVELQRAGKLEEARSKFKTSYQLHANPEVLFDLGMTEAQLKLSKEARDTLRRYLAAGGSAIPDKRRTKVEKKLARLDTLIAKSANRDDGIAALKEGKGFFAKKQYERARIAFDKSYKLHPDFGTLFYVARTAAKLDRHEQALNAYTRFLEEGGKSVAADRRAEANREIKRLRPMIDAAANEEKSRRHFAKGVELYNQRKHERAIAEFEKAYKLNPSYRTLYNLGQAQAEAKLHSRALKSYRTYLEKGGSEIPDKRRKEVKKQIEWLSVVESKAADKEKSHEHFKKGLRLRKEKRFEAALQEFEKAYELYQNYKILYSIGRTAEKLGQNERARSAYDRYLADGGSKVSKERWAKVKSDIARLDQLRKEESTKKQSAEHFEKGLSFKKRREYDKARKEFEIAYGLYPSYKIYLSLARTESLAGNNDKAIDAYHRYLAEGGDRVPKDKRAKVDKEIERLRDSKARAEKKGAAKQHLERGIAFKKKKKLRQAVYELEKAVELAEDHEAFFHLAECQVELGSNAEALKLYNRYLSKGGGKVSKAKRAEVKKKITRLYPLVGRIQVECSIRGAKVRVDGETEGKTPLTRSIIVDAGDHEVVVKKDGKELMRKKVSLSAGERISLQVKANIS